jgi:hypothetical protein
MTTACDFRNSPFSDECFDPSRFSVKTTTVHSLYLEIVEELPKAISKIRRENNKEIEVCDIDENMLQDILHYAGEEIGHLHEGVYAGQRFNKRLSLTIRELFFQKIIEYGLKYRTPESSLFMDELTRSVTVNGVPVSVRLSTLLGHRFDGHVYSFSEPNSSYIALKSTNLKFYKCVYYMMIYFDEIDCPVWVDYPQFSELLDDGTELVRPLELWELHRTHSKDCTYYNNHWVGNQKYRSSHSNSIMAILSHIKHLLYHRGHVERPVNVP